MNQLISQYSIAFKKKGYNLVNVLLSLEEPTSSKGRVLCDCELAFLTSSDPLNTGAKGCYSKRSK